MELPLATSSSVGRMLAIQADRYGNKPFLLHRDEAISYGEMYQRALRGARGFWELGIRRGDKVCLLVGNRPEFLEVVYGLLSIGAVEVPINTAYKGELLAYILNHSDARGLVLEAEYAPRLAEIQSLLPNLEWVCLVDDPWPLESSGWPVHHLVDFHQLPASLPEVEVSPYDLGGIMYTSGTTGPSKGVLCSHHYFYSYGSGWSRAVRLREDDVYYTCLPYFHFNAQIACTYTSLITGATVAMDSRFSASRFWDSVRGHGANAFNLLGAMCQILYKQPPSPRDRDHQVRFCSAVPAPAEIYEDFQDRFGVLLLEGYGSTEANMPLYMPYDAPRKGSCGKPWEGLDVEIVDENDLAQPPTVRGEIVVRPRSPWTIMSGYYKMPEETVKAWRNLWFHTGDRGYKDEDGYFYFVDRIKDAIRRRGENISAYEIERIVNQHPAVLESAAIAVPSEMSEDEVKIVVVLQSGASLEHAEIVTFAAERMAYFMVPRYVEFVDELPKTPNTKVEKHKLRAVGITPATWDREAVGLRIRRD